MKSIDIYDPAQCCASGACSPSADDELAQFAASLEWLKGQGIAVSRYNLGHQPGAFVQNALVKTTMEQDGVQCLPLVVVDGRIVSKGRYPSRSELGEKLRLTATTRCATADVLPNKCCG